MQTLTTKHKKHLTKYEGIFYKEIINQNNKVVLSEALRVLKQNGILIITTDVATQNTNNIRKYQDAFTGYSIKEIFDFIEKSCVKENLSIKLINKLKKLTIQDIHSFWKKTKQFEIRKTDIREYLAIGFFYKKEKFVKLTYKEKINHLLQGQKCINDTLIDYQNIAKERELELIKKEKALINITNIAQTLYKKENNNFFVKILKKLRFLK